MSFRTAARRFAGATLAVALSATVALAQGTDFSGTWKLDASRSEMGPMGGRGGGATTLTIAHADPTLTVKRTIETPNGERTQEQKFTTDGKASVNAGMRGNEVTTFVSWAGANLVMKTTQMMRENEIRVEETWSLADDGKTLVIERKMETPMGELTTKQVFAKAG